MMRTSNPTLNQAVFAKERSFGVGDSMTIQGTVNKCFILLGLIVLSASWVWGKVMQPTSVLGGEMMAKEMGAQAAASVTPFIFGGAIGGFILALVTIFNKPASKITAPLYALCEGLVLGGVSAIFEQNYPGIVIQAVGLTFATMFCMLSLYKSRIIKVNEKFIFGVATATGAICLVYLVNFIMSFFGRSIPFIYSSGLMGIGFSLLVVGIAAMNLILDFYVIEEGSKAGAPKYMEWYGAFALMVTLIWLYLEILRLLAKMRSRR